MGSVAILLTGNGTGELGGLYSYWSASSVWPRVTDTLRGVATQQMPAYHKQIGQRAGHE
jgi:hypothetical protein